MMRISGIDRPGMFKRFDEKLTRVGEKIDNGLAYVKEKASAALDRIVDSLVYSTYIGGMHNYYDDFVSECGDEYDEKFDDYKDFYDAELADVLTNDSPDKVYVGYDIGEDKTIVVLYDDEGENYFDRSYDGHLVNEYNSLIYRYTTKDSIKKKEDMVVNVTVIRGGKYQKPGKGKKVKIADAGELVGRTLVRVKNDQNRQALYVKPIFPRDVEDAEGFRENYPLFMFRLIEMGSEFDIDKVFENLNTSLGKDIFNDNTIDQIAVTYGGGQMALKTKDGVMAFLDLYNGRREVRDNNPEDGLKMLLADTYGPLVEY